MYNLKGHNKSNEDFIYLEMCLSLIQEKLEWGSAEKWTNNNYERLHALISEKTGVHISITTLNRIFGKKYTTSKDYYNPQLATKNALAQFLDYKNWNEFKLKNENLIQKEEVQFSPQPHNDSDKISATNVIEADVLVKKRTLLFEARLILINAILLFIIGVSIYYYYRNTLKPDFTFEPETLTASSNTTIGFRYDISNLKAKKVLIDLDNVEYPLPKDKNYFSNFFQFPHFYHIRLIADGKVLYKNGIHIQNKQWTTIFSHNYVFHKIGNSLSITGGKMSLDPKMVDSLKLKYTDKEYWVEYRLIDNFEADGDNFTLETSCKNSILEGGIYCHDTEIQIVGENSDSRITLINPNCSNFVKIKFGDISAEGEYTNLSGFEQDMSEWKNVQIKVNNKTANVFIEGKKVYSINYNEPVGKIKGITFRFKGLGSVDYVKLYNNTDEQPVYSNTFD